MHSLSKFHNLNHFKMHSFINYGLNLILNKEDIVRKEKENREIRVRYLQILERKSKSSFISNLITLLEGRGTLNAADIERRSVVITEESTHVNIGILFLGLLLNLSDLLSGGSTGGGSDDVNGVLGSLLHLISLLERVV
jgi:hypothetical protein